MATVARFGSDGFIRKQQELEQQITAFSLTLLTNIVMAWNTVYIQEILGDFYDIKKLLKLCFFI